MFHLRDRKSGVTRRESVKETSRARFLSSGTRALYVGSTSEKQGVYPYSERGSNHDK